MDEALTVTIDGRTFEFPAGWQALIYDKWPLHSQLSGGAIKAKGCDVVALDPAAHTLYLIEAKDYAHPSVKEIPAKLPDTIVQKGFDTLAGIFAGAKLGESFSPFCQQALNCQEIILALSIEMPDPLPEGQSATTVLSFLQERIAAGARYLTTAPLVTLASAHDTPWRCYPSQKSPGVRPKNLHGDS